MILLTLFILHLAFSVHEEPFVDHFYLLWLKVVTVFSCVIRIISACHNFFIAVLLAISFHEIALAFVFNILGLCL